MYLGMSSFSPSYLYNNVYLISIYSYIINNLVTYIMKTKLTSFKLEVTIKGKLKFDIYYRQEVAYSDSYIASCLQLVDINKDVDYYLTELSKLVNFPTEDLPVEEYKILEGIHNKEERNKIFKLIYCIKSILINTIDGTSVNT